MTIQPQPYQPPAMPLPSERVILTPPLSFDGATRRIWRRLHPATQDTAGWARTGRVCLLWAALLGAWLGVLVWYAFWVALGLVFLPITIVWLGLRYERKLKRRRDWSNLRHRELVGRQIQPPR